MRQPFPGPRFASDGQRKLSSPSSCLPHLHLSPSHEVNGVSLIFPSPSEPQHHLGELAHFDSFNEAECSESHPSNCSQTPCPSQCSFIILKAIDYVLALINLDLGCSVSVEGRSTRADQKRFVQVRYFRVTTLSPR